MKYKCSPLSRSSNGPLYSALKTVGVGGFTLIEVMITATLVAIGLLGHLSMQARNLDMNRAGLYHSKASELINEMAERMQNNLDGVLAGNYQIPSTQPLLALRPKEPIPADFCSDCSQAGDIAQLDLGHWQAGMRELAYFSSTSGEVLAEGTIALKSQTTQYVTYEIAIAWPRIKEITEQNATQSAAPKQRVSMIVGFNR